jgi:DeoR/GlpR family transcriptional regulator of sugar metabolism
MALSRTTSSAAPLSVRERLDAIRQREFITVEELALLVGVSERTIWRRLTNLPHVIRTGRITRIHRVAAVRYFLSRPA